MVIQRSVWSLSELVTSATSQLSTTRHVHDSALALTSHVTDTLNKVSHCLPPAAAAAAVSTFLSNLSVSHPSKYQLL